MAAPSPVLSDDNYFKVVIAATNANQGTKYQGLKEKQREALVACRDGDVVAVLPTGYGKTVVIHLLPFLQPESPPTSVIVVAPLNAIITEQKARFGTSCLVVDDQLLEDLEEGTKSESVKRLKTGSFLYLLGHPEAITHKALREVLMEGVLEKKISHVVVDESHCILSWGRSKFREAFLDLGCLKITLPDAKTVALTATATPEAILEIQDALHMLEPVCVKASPDRPSVYLEVKRRPPGTGTNHNVETSYAYCTNPLLQELKEMEELFPRTIVYLPLQWCGHTHKKALGVLTESAKHVAVQPPDEEEVKSFVAQFHAPQTSQMKTLISTTMLQPNSQLRLLLATEAYGMGADCPDVRRVIHVGPPKNMETYAQEIGRCARDGAPGRATLYFNNGDVAARGKKKKRDTIHDTDVDIDSGSESDESVASDDSDETPINIKGAEKKPDKQQKNEMTVAMRKFCKNTTVCRREVLMAYFGFMVVRSDVDECCDICSGTVETDYAKSPPDPKADPVITRMLMEYFALENEEVNEANCISEIHTGLCLSLAKKIASYPHRYSKGDALTKHFPYLTNGNISNIQNVLTFGLSN